VCASLPAFSRECVWVGRMGNDRVTMQNLRVEVVDAEKNLLAVRGSVPGRKGGIVLVRAAT
jgi:large subunit ribosomal protein L3